MPARGDHHWRKSDSHPAATAGAFGGIVGDIVCGQ
jgi:hypothetical protein